MKPGDIVFADTDTAFDQEGVPVSIRKGLRHRVFAVNQKFVQLLVNWKGSGFEVLGIPNHHAIEVCTDNPYNLIR